jgi:hypothetical protein
MNPNQGLSSMDTGNAILDRSTVGFWLKLSKISLFNIWEHLQLVREIEQNKTAFLLWFSTILLLSNSINSTVNQSLLPLFWNLAIVIK